MRERETEGERAREGRKIGGERASEINAAIEWHGRARSDRCNKTVLYLYWNGQLVWTPALALYLCVGDRGPGTGDCVQRDLSPTSGYTGISARRRYANFFICSRFPRGHYLLWLVWFSLV